MTIPEYRAGFSSVAYSLMARARNSPDDIALGVGPYSSARDLLPPLGLTYGQLGGAAAELATVFGRRLGTYATDGNSPGVLGPPAKAVVLMGSKVEFVITVAALWWAGIIPVPMNPQSTARELDHILTDSSPQAIIFGGNSNLGRNEIESIASAISKDQEPQVWDGAIDARLAITETLKGQSPAELRLPAAATPDSAALIIYTSGTTGKPKGAVLSHSNLLANCEALRSAWAWTAADRLLLTLPLFHAHGLCVGVLGSLHAGASFVLHDTFDAAKVADSLADPQITLFFGVPTIYTALIELMKKSEPSIASDTNAADSMNRDWTALYKHVRLFVSGSAPLSTGDFEAFKAATGKQVLERYGTSEALMILSNPLNGVRKAGSVGLPLPRVQVRLFQSAPGEPGEIQVKGPSVFSGYLNLPEQSLEALSDGWLRTGDLANVDEDGYYFILGRSKELIITGGFNVYPVEVEEVLKSHPAVDDAAVVGIKSSRWGEQVEAFVVGNPSCQADLEVLLRGSLLPYKRPKAIHFVESIPRNSLGKVQRHLLAQPSE